jgi:hypothetical protein
MGKNNEEGSVETIIMKQGVRGKRMRESKRKVMLGSMKRLEGGFIFKANTHPLHSVSPYAVAGGP